MKYDNGKVKASIEAYPETTRDVLQRSRIIPRLVDANKDLNEEDAPACMFWYPTAATCSGTITWIGAGENGADIEKSIKELTLDEFLNLPGKLWDSWLEEVAEQNPHLFEATPVGSKKN